jgi:hypothetical protein
MNARKGTYEKAKKIAANLPDEILLHVIKKKVPSKVGEHNIKSVVRVELRRRGYEFKKKNKKTYYDENLKAWVTNWSLLGPYKDGRKI